MGFDVFGSRAARSLSPVNDASRCYRRVSLRTHRVPMSSCDDKSKRRARAIPGAVGRDRAARANAIARTRQRASSSHAMTRDLVARHLLRHARPLMEVTVRVILLWLLGVPLSLLILLMLFGIL